MGCSGKGTFVPFHRAHMYFPEENPGCREVKKAPKGSGLSVLAWRETIHMCWGRGFENQTMEFHLFSHCVVLLAAIWSQNFDRKQWMNSLFFSAWVQLLLYPLNYLFLKSFLTFLLLPLFSVPRGKRVAGLKPLQDWSSSGGRCLQEKGKSHGNWWKEHVVKPLTKKMKWECIDL